MTTIEAVMRWFRIFNRVTHEWWEGEAEDPLDACKKAGWAKGDCHIKERSVSGYGGWKKAIK